MRSCLANLASLALALVSLCCHGSALAQTAQTRPAPAPPAQAANSWQQQLIAWRAQREHELTAPDGPLTLVGLEWLKPGANSFGAAPDNQLRINARAPDHFGLLTVFGTTVQLLSPAGGFPPDFKIDGAPAREGTLSISDQKPSTMTWHSLSMVVLRRGDRFVLRAKDGDSTARTAFRGLHWYPPDERYRIVARWIPYSPPHIEKIPTVIGATLDMNAPGIAEFTLDGKTLLQLEPVIANGDTSGLFFILRDETGKTTTYATGRYLIAGLPDHGLTKPGLMLIDFNRLYNPPCAYTSYATCPLPPARNILPVAIPAGEQRYTQ